MSRPRTCPLPHRHRGDPCHRCDAQDTAVRDCPRQAAAGSAVCGGHLRGLERQVAELPALVEAMLRPTGGRGAPVGRVTTSGHAEIVVNGPGVEHRRVVHAVLASWVKAIADDLRSASWPADTIPAMCVWLLARMQPITGAVYVADLVAEVGDLHDRARRLAWPSQARRITVGQCPETVLCDVATRTEQRCTGRVTAVVGLSEPQDAVCGACGHITPPHRLHALGRRLRAAEGQRRYAPAADVALLLATEGQPVPESTLRWWAAQGLVGTATVAGRVRYDVADAETAATRRQEAS